MSLPHFDLIYDAKHQDLANLYADRLEDNLSFLKNYFEFFPERTTVVLNDRTDMTNGYATPIPQQLIMVFPVLPGPHETISDYGDWARELTMHEYTHILSFEPRRGWMAALHAVFGNVITPNILLPRWWLEGIAVDMETRNSPKGRLRSPYQDASLRAYAIDDDFESIKLGQINETSIYTWPQGARPYLFGSLMWSELIANYGQKQIRELHWRYGGRVPFFIEAPMRDQTDGTYQELFDQMMGTLEKRTAHQLTQLKKTPLIQGPTLKIDEGMENYYPSISPDGKKMILLSKGDALKRAVIILQRPSLQVPFEGRQTIGEIDQKIDEGLGALNPRPFTGVDDSGATEDGPPGGTIQRLAWFPDSHRFIFDKLDELNRFHDTSDLYFYDLKTRKVERLTHGERAREASVSPSGGLVAYVKLDAGQTHLGIYNLTEKKASVVYSPGLQGRISWPTFFNENEVLFSLREKNEEKLYRWNLTTQKLDMVLGSFPDARFPNMTSLGLTFTSTLNGTGNVYLADASLKSAMPISHSGTMVTTSAFDSARNEFYVSELSTQGFQIRRVDKNQWQTLPKSLPAVEGLFADRYPAQFREVPVTQKPEAEDYSPWSYMWPQYWLPGVSSDGNSSQFGAATSGSDPLGKHLYSLQANYDDSIQETSFNGAYLNNSTAAQIRALGLDYRTNVVNSGTEFREQFYSLDASWQVLPVSTDFYAGLGWVWSARTYTNTRREQGGPALLLNYQDFSMSGAQISPESGQSASARVIRYLPGDSAQIEDFHLYQLSMQKYFSRWLPRHHVIFLRAQGQFIDEDVSSANNAFTIGYTPFANTPSPFYIMRGYLNGQFLGKSLANYTFEYRFPILYPNGDAGTTPIFVKKVYGSLIADGLNIDGSVYNSDHKVFEKIEGNKSFWSAGAELKFDLTLGYQFPITFFAGYYWPLDARYQNGRQYALGFQVQ